MSESVKISNNTLPADCSRVSPVAVLTKYAPLVKSRALAFMCPELELDDIIQEGNIGLFTASLRYDSRIASFATFARKCIDSAIIDYLRRSRKLSHIPNDLFVDINGLELADSAPNPEISVSEKEEYEGYVERAITLLSKFEYSVFEGLLQGLSHKEIAQSLCVDIKAVRNAVQRIRAKIK